MVQQVSTDIKEADSFQSQAGRDRTAIDGWVEEVKHLVSKAEKDIATDDDRANEAAALAEKAKKATQEKAIEAGAALQIAQAKTNDIITNRDSAMENAAIGSSARSKAEKKYNDAVATAQDNPADIDTLQSLLAMINKYQNKAKKAENAIKDAYLSVIDIEVKFTDAINLLTNKVEDAKVEAD